MPSTELPKVIVEGKTIELTQENVKNYLGKVVTNFKQDYEGQEETVHIENEDYQVSKKYRLYYVDFENKYGDGEGTIYLKADCTNHNYRLQLDETDAEGNKGIRIKQLNPELYKDKEGNEKASPAVTNPNMQAVTWLLNENNWSSLKNGVTIKTEDINYIVGTPSLEMMMDSYNTKYANVIEDVDKPDYTDITPGGEDRRKLFYQYNNSTNGYQVGPCANDKKEYGDSTSDNSVWTDPNIDTLYYPGKIDDSGNRYWLASPSSYLADCMFGVRYSQGGSIFCDYYYYFNNAFCPLVSLKSTVKLELK